MIEPRRTPERAAMLARVASVAGAADAHALDSERGATLAPAVVEALRASGLFTIAAPRELGGAECDPLTQTEVFEAMARADSSAGWTLMIGALCSALVGAYLPPASAARVFGGSFPITAGLLQPAGVARRTAGGFVVSGRWPFGSGVRHAGWIVTGAVLDPDRADAQGPPALVSVVVPVDRVRIERTWDAAGLRGSGSEHYTMAEVQVEEAFTFPFPTAPPRRGGALYRLPLLAFLMPGHLGFSLGVARRALDEIAAAAPKRNKMWTRAPLAGHAAFQMDLGRAEAKLAAARAFAMETAGAVWDRALAGEDLGHEEWMAVRLATTYVAEVAAEVATFAFRAGGGTALYASSALQRCFRDAEAAAHHVAASDDAYEFAGRARLGATIEPSPMLAPRSASPRS